MIISRVSRKMALQSPFIEHDEVIQTLSADAANQALDVSPLPRRTWRSQYLLDAHRSDLIHELIAEDTVTIAQQIVRRSFPRERFPKLVSRPLSRRMRC